jgi:type I restriction enzyme, S subunit
VSGVTMTPLRELGEWSGGNTPSKANAAYWDSGTVPWVSPKDMKVDEIASSEDQITDQALADGKVSLVPAGSVLFVTRSGILAHTFPVAVTKLPVTINQDLKALSPKAGVSPKYVAHAVRGASQRILKECSKHGTTVASVDTKALLDFEIPLVALDEQHAIVAEIEKQFSRLDEAVANLQRVKANLRRTTASTYQSAIDGTLTEPIAARSSTSAANAMDGKDLLARIQEMHRATWSGRGKYQAPSTPSFQGLPELPQDWLWTTWGQIGHAQNGRPFPSKEYTDSGIKLLRPGNMHQSGGLVWSESNTRLVPERYEPENADLRIGGGELVMNLTAQSLKDEFLGRVCLTSEGERCLLNQRLARLTPCGFPTAFALIVFKSRWFRTFVDRLNTGSLIQHMFTSQLESFPFPLPPLVEQRRIVAEVDRRLSIIREVEAEVDANLKRAQALRQAVLSKAFGVTQ